jgi:tRNA threonylcarbamoyladenosine biosynthesis protein TsaE
MPRQIESSSAAATEAAGAELARTLVPGDVVLLEGELGAGKTTFVRGACRALGVTAPVRSPTFTIGAVYAGRVRIAHLDLYRVADLDAEDPELLDDYLRPDTIAFVEWAGTAAGRLGTLGRIAATVRIAHAGGDRREVSIA